MVDRHSDSDHSAVVVVLALATAHWRSWTSPEARPQGLIFETVEAPQQGVSPITLIKARYENEYKAAYMAPMDKAHGLLIARSKAGQGTATHRSTLKTARDQNGKRRAEGRSGKLKETNRLRSSIMGNGNRFSACASR